VLIGLSERHWDHLPVDLETEVRDMTRKHGAKHVEDTFNTISRKMRTHLASLMGPILQWHRATVSTVLRDCDHRLVEPLPEDAGNTASMPDAMFKAHMNTDVSWGESSLSILMNSIGAWPSPSPPKFQTMGIMYRARLDSRGDSDRMSEIWKSLLLVAGSACVRRASVNTFDMAHWVIYVTEWGALVVRIR
jgi:hypothetical protein